MLALPSQKSAWLVASAIGVVGWLAPLAQAAPTYNHDMSPYEKMAKEAIKLVEASDLKGALKKAQALEEKWDTETTDLKKADPALWNLIDKQMDAAIEALEASDAKKSAEELKSYLDKLGRVPKPK